MIVYDINLKKIKGLMAEHGLTQKDLAIVIDLSPQQMVKKLDGRADLKVGELLKIANHFGEHPSIFFAEQFAQSEGVIANR